LQILNKLKVLSLVVLVLGCLAGPSYGDHLGRLERAEPFFTEKAFLEKELEFNVGIDNGKNERSVGLGIVADWIFLDRLQLGFEVPFVIRDPDNQKSVSAFSDIGLSSTVLFCCTRANSPYFLSLTGGILLPTGDDDKGIGGTGEWSFSLNSAYFFTFGPDIGVWGIQLQLAYAQQLKLSDDQKSIANMFNIDKKRTKDLIWNAALSQQYFNGKFTPVFEILGTTTVDSMQSEEEGTILELGIGFWVSPFSDTSLLNAVNLGAAAKFPVTELEETSSSFLFVTTYGF